jgi:hypothetical protein
MSFCPFHAIIGLPCPGCGMTRAMIRLGQLKLEEAIEYNPFSVLLLLSMILYMGTGKYPFFLRHKVFNIILLVVVFLVWLRHLSGLQAI